MGGGGVQGEKGKDGCSSDSVCGDWTLPHSGQYFTPDGISAPHWRQCTMA
jgi:hypothetical protein